MARYADQSDRRLVLLTGRFTVMKEARRGVINIGSRDSILAPAMAPLTLRARAAWSS